VYVCQLQCGVIIVVVLQKMKRKHLSGVLSEQSHENENNGEIDRQTKLIWGVVLQKMKRKQLSQNCDSQFNLEWMFANYSVV
jgi:hypothetical protein